MAGSTLTTFESEDFSGSGICAFCHSRLTDEAGKERYPLVLTRPIKNGFAARLGGVETKEDADALIDRTQRELGLEEERVG